MGGVAGVVAQVDRPIADQVMVLIADRAAYRLAGGCVHYAASPAGHVADRLLSADP